MTLLESFHPRRKDSPGVVPSQDRGTPLESFHHPGQNRLPWSRYPLPWSRSQDRMTEGVVATQDRRTPMESFQPRIEGLPWSRSILGLNDSPGVVLSQDRMTPLQSFYPRKEGLPWSRSIQGQKTPLESFPLRTEGLPWSRSIIGHNDSPGVVLS